VRYEGVVRRLLGYLARYRRRSAVGVLCLIVTASLAMAIPRLLKAAVDSIDPSRPHESGHAVAWYALGVIGIAIVQAIARSISRFTIFNVGRDVEYDLRNDVFAHLERLPTSYYLAHPTGDLMSRLVNDIGAVRMMLGPGILNLLNTPIYYLWAVSIMASIDPLLTVAALLPYPFMLLVVKHYSRRLMEGTLHVQEGLAEMSNAIQENTSGIAVVKAYALEDRSIERFSALNTSFRKSSLELGRVRGVLAPVFRSVSALGTLVVLWLGGSRVAAGRLGIGDLVAFIGYLHLLAWPTMALGWMLSIVQRGRASLRRLDEILDTSPEIADPVDADPAAEVAAVAAAAPSAHANTPAIRATAGNGNGNGNGGGALAVSPPSPVRPRTLRGAIEFAGVSFAYPGGRRPALRDVDLRVPAGATVALVGRAGAGKSTLLRLLPRLFDPTAGVIRIDGEDLRRFPLAELRRSIAFVPQDPFLFSTSLRENLAFARPELLAKGEAGFEDLRRAAERAAVAGDIEDFSRGYETMVGERGITLSGGQKQRVTLARALLVDDAPILVLDDSLSSVDTRTEARILAALEKRRRGRTCLLVAHRLSTVQDADLIVVLDEGRIVERGDHASLLRARGLYADLFHRQQLTAELEEI
jgi:ATP-binding cassette, subfamily B, multidrug efflux pump